MINKKIFTAWVISLIFYILFLFFASESVVYGIIFLIYSSLIFFVVSYRNKEKLEYFLFIAENLRKYFFPAFALYSGWLLFLAYNTPSDLSFFIVIWYFMLFLFENLIVLIPSFSILDKNIKSVFARIYFVTTTFIFGLGFSALSGALAGTNIRKNFNWINFNLDKRLFTLLSYAELIIIIFLMIYFFKFSKNKVREES